MRVFDTLQNLLSGLGTGKDKGASNTFVVNEIQPDVLMKMYRGDWIARKLVDIPPQDITKNWRHWKADKDVVEKIEAVEKSSRINLAARTCFAGQTARLLGGSIMYFSLKDQRPETPLNLDKIKEGDLRFTRVFNRFELGEEGFIDDIENEFFGHPEFYTIPTKNGENVRIHPSRVVQYVGLPRIDMGGKFIWWGDSVLQVAYDAVVNASSSQGHVAGLVPEAKTDVMYIPGLGDMLSTSEGTAALTARFQYASVMKSMYNMVLLDGIGAETAEGESVGESWAQKQIRFADLSDLLTHFLQAVAGAGDIPLTRFLQQSAAGLNATGEGELRNYYDSLTGRQKNEVAPALSAFDEVLIRSATGSRDASIWYEWAPLWLGTPEQQSKSFFEKAQGVEKLWNTGLIPAPALSEAVVNAFVEDGSLPGLEAAIEKHGDFSALPEAEQQTARHTAPPPASPTGAPGAPGATKVAGAPATGLRSGSPPARAANDAQPRSLYVRRDLINKAEFNTWAKSQGFKDLVPDLHVTILYSRAAVDWMQMGQGWFSQPGGKLTVEPGGPRVVEALGDQGAIVLFFASTDICWRHDEMIERGASHDYEEFQPHVTITYDGQEVDLTGVTPYAGKLEFGPEIFEEIKERT